MSVDPFIQAPSSTQSINPYSYIMNNPLAGTDPTGYVGKCDQNPTCQMQSFFSSVGSGGSSLIGNLMGRLKTTLTNGHDTKRTTQTQKASAAAEVMSPAAVSFVLNSGGYFDGGEIAKNCQHCRFINGNEGSGGGSVPGLTHHEKIQAAAKGSDDLLDWLVIDDVKETVNGIANGDLPMAAAGIAKLGCKPCKVVDATTVTSRIKESQKLIRAAQAADKSHQAGIDKLTKQLNQGNLNPGIGTKPIGQAKSKIKVKIIRIARSRAMQGCWSRRSVRRLVDCPV